MHRVSRLERVANLRSDALLTTTSIFLHRSISTSPIGPQNSFTGLRTISASRALPPFLSHRLNFSSPLPTCRQPHKSHFHHSTRQTCLTSQKLNMGFHDPNDPGYKDALEASMGDTNGSPNQDSDTPKPTPKAKEHVVDLTAESDDDELTEVFPKSNSVVRSETDEGDYDDDDDEDLKRAIELSKQDSRDDVDLVELPDSPGKGRRLSDSEPTSSGDSRPMGLLGLDRKQMEEERLARIAKRKADDPLADECEPKHLKISHSPKGNATSLSSRTPSGQAKVEQKTPSNRPGVQFPSGIVRRTWAFGCAREGDDIKIEEVFQQSDLELAVLSSFMWDMEWLFSKLDTRRIRFLMIMQAKEDYTKRQYESDTADMPNMRLCFPPMDGQVNCMHSKLMLLFHPGYVRIVVPTANLLPFDWGEQGGIMENSVFLIDLPKITDRNSTETSKTPFYEELVHFLSASTLHPNIVAKLDDFDFSETAHLAFVHTIGGSHVNDAWRRTGYCGLGRAVGSLGLLSSSPVNIDFVTSSIGSLTNEFLRSIYLAAQGDDGLTEYTLRTAKSFPAKNSFNPNHLIQKTTAQEWTDRFRVYFPSEETVEGSKGGPRSAGTICFQEKWFEGPKFPRHVLRDCRSLRPTLMHNKIMYVKPDNPIPFPGNDSPNTGSQAHAWAYVGSANLSESAWGRLVQDKTTKTPKLNCRNWECGVLVPVISQAKNEGDNGSNKSGQPKDSLDVFRGTVPVPLRLPGRRFEGGLKPWYFSF